MGDRGRGIRAVLQSGLGRLWARHRGPLVGAGIVIVAAALLGRAVYEYPRLLWRDDGSAAIDLRFRQAEVHRFFAGEPVYGPGSTADYPPASYVMLWPFLGLLPLAAARWLWAVVSVLQLGWLARLGIRGSNGANTSLERVGLTLLIFASAPANVAIGVGQLSNVVVPILSAAILMVASRPATWRNDLVAALLLTFTLVKPTLSAPFLWLVLFVPGRLRPALSVAAAYASVAAVASLCRGAGPIELLREWSTQQSELTFHEGYANLHKLVAALGHEDWMLPASLLTALALGAWVYRHRGRDVWILLGVCAIVSRVWTHHRGYDDLLIVLANIATFRIYKHAPPASDTRFWAGTLCAVGWVSLLVPARLHTWASPWPSWTEGFQTTAWLSMLALLLVHAKRTAGRAEGCGQTDD